MPGGGGAGDLLVEVGRGGRGCEGGVGGQRGYGLGYEVGE